MPLKDYGKSAGSTGYLLISMGVSLESRTAKAIVDMLLE